MSRGPIPKDPAARVRRNKEHRTVVDPDAVVDAPNLPGSWSPDVLRWYGNWCASPQAQLFAPTDWQRLRMIAPLIDRYFVEPDPKLLAEIRLNESLLGATIVDRLRLRLDVRKPSTTPAPPPQHRRGLTVVDGINP